MSSGPTPIFLFSLPRSGSTLLQRLLGAHSEIATVSEPWILLPLLYTLRSEGVYAEYNHSSAAQALQDFCETLPNGQEDYIAAVRDLTLGLYSKASKKDSRYFLDKTPRYHLLANDIISAFPNSKFVFLWRNPLAVTASMRETWAGGRWSLYRHKVDIFAGLESLTNARKQYRDISCAVRYEDLVENSDDEVERILRYLDLPFEPSILTKLGKTKLSGRMGDHSDMAGYSRLSEEPVNKWKATLANPIRKRWCQRYLRWIGEERLSLMGYDINKLYSDLECVPTSLRWVGSDIVRGGYGIAYELLEPTILKRKLRSLSSWRYVYAHH